MPEAIKIGTKTLTEPADFIQTYETAAWSRTIHCEAQTVDVMAVIKNGEVEDRSIGWTFKGEVIKAHFPSTFDGVQMTDGERPEEIGKPDTYSVVPYAHALAYSLLEGKELNLALDVVPLYSPFRDSQGEGRYSAGLYLDPTEDMRERSRGVELALAHDFIPHKSPEAVFGWAIAHESMGRELEEQAKRMRHSADSALSMYAPEYRVKPALESVDETSRGL